MADQPKRDEELRLRVARDFIDALPHARTLGMQVAHLGEGEARIVMPWNEKLIGDPQTRVIHGGAVSALMDTCSGAAVMAHPEAPVSTATIDLRIDYMRAAVPGQVITARATVFHMTRTVAFIRATAHDEEGLDLPVATATGAFTVERAS
ncbi:thioesterase [Thioclava sp. SK-1]|uniref:PaaI family thioesterase n=1 Tax=Thioclava sp. SK-1 TaxID=1889770 RepID=UPI0008255213|nr:PaaI family thioesterase [Thioclava sp. SK-1]OCX66736.1 thioesterase [Thioclava sp. SK-1]